MTQVLHEETLSLDPVPLSVRTARRFVRDLLRRSAREDWLDAAELAVSEVVTNAVLHGHTQLQVTARVTPDALRVEVHDDNPQLPQQRDYEKQATTGRGMDLIAALTAECGVVAVPSDGKTVWFVVRDEAPGDGSAPADAWEVEAPADPTHLARRVVLRDLPPTLWLAARQHHDAVLREYALWAAEHGDVDPAAVQMADRARSWISTAVVEAVARAEAEGRARSPLPEGHPSPLPPAPPTIDLEIGVEPDAAEAFLALQDVLDAAERLAVADRLLVRPGLPEVVALRDWACDQAVAQLSGVAPSPWPGTDQERFTVQTHARDAVEDLEWDADVVRTSDRGVVAADDANRIVAISAPLAQRLGWEVDDLVGRRVVALIPPRLREAHVAGFSRHLTTGEAHVLGVPLRLPVLKADGTEAMCEYLVEEAPGAAGRAVYLAWMTLED